MTLPAFITISRLSSIPWCRLAATVFFENDDLTFEQMIEKSSLFAKTTLSHLETPRFIDLQSFASFSLSAISHPPL